MLKAGYICNKCGMDVMDVDVRERVENEDVRNYVHHVGNTCGRDHGIRSPLCCAQVLDIKVPMTQNGIGFTGPELTEQDQEDIKAQLGGS